MNHEIIFKNTGLNINGKDIPDTLERYEAGIENDEAYMITTMEISAGDTLNYKCRNNTKVTFEIRAKDTMKSLFNCCKQSD